MKNLKITLYLENACVLDRLTTIDAILLAAYYRFNESKGIKLAFDKEHKTVDFIHREKGVFSGSIWYVEEDDFVGYDFATIVKKPEYRKMYDLAKAKTVKNARFKSAMIQEEKLLIEKLHFYIRGDALKIEALIAKIVKNIGKYPKFDYGRVSDYEIEEIEKDKGFMINESTPSKPLPVEDFNVNSKKVAFSRRMAPYWLNEDIEACYMPTSSLYETKDNSAENEMFEVAKDISYISNIQFAHDVCNDPRIQKDKDFASKTIDYSKETLSKKISTEYIENGANLKCCVSGDIKNSGYKNDIRKYFTSKRVSFSDHYHIKNDFFISKESLWVIDNLAALSYIYLSNDKVHYLQGKFAKDGKRINDYIKDLSMLKPPFSINLKSSKNAQHVVFKGKVSLSNAYFYIQYGDDTLSIDGEMLINAIEEINDITQKNPEITKSHLCRNFRDFYNINLKSKNRQINEIIVMNFQKKYDKSIRKLLALIAL